MNSLRALLYCLRRSIVWACTTFLRLSVVAGDLIPGPVVRSRRYAEAAEAQPGIPPQPSRQAGAPWSAQAPASGGQPPAPSYEGMAGGPPPPALAEVAAAGGVGTLGMWYHKISL